MTHPSLFLSFPSSSLVSVYKNGRVEQLGEQIRALEGEKEALHGDVAARQKVCVCVYV